MIINYEYALFAQVLISEAKNKNMNSLSDKIKKLIVEKLGVEESEVTPGASFTGDLGADSLDKVELVMEFEKEFNISIPDEQAEAIATVGDAVSYLEKHVEVKN